MAILLIHAGGTIGMVESDEGFSPAQGVVEDHVNQQVAEGLFPPMDIIRLDPLIDSANATPHDWHRIAITIAEKMEAYDGFIVAHGTDTLAYTAAALTFALEGLAKPVILTGAMLPIGVEGSDGPENLAASVSHVQKAPAGVWVQFAGRHLHGSRVRKSHSRQFDAFAADPGEYPPLRSGPAFRLHQPRPWNIVILAVAPGMSDNVARYAAETCDGIVLRCYGSGTVPHSEGLEKALATAWQRGCPVFAVSQCPEGGLALGTYAAGAVLKKYNVIDGRDITLEAAYAKLVFILSQEANFARQRQMLQTPLAGEMHTAN
ncbi:asparaginase [uncultured Cohaesibacter sp.]|uniref:asparaginase n=1 Tax=uncultured Cohaesibacter sp. TaxID=1002546 RepID=UPI0029C7F368|nr:asparaginase [uncultured Cohaesibacter sp.]